MGLSVKEKMKRYKEIAQSESTPKQKAKAVKTVAQGGNVNISNNQVQGGSIPLTDPVTEMTSGEYKQKKYEEYQKAQKKRQEFETKISSYPSEQIYYNPRYGESGQRKYVTGAELKDVFKPELQQYREYEQAKQMEYSRAESEIKPYHTVRVRKSGKTTIYEDTVIKEKEIFKKQPLPVQIGRSIWAGATNWPRVLYSTGVGYTKSVFDKSNTPSTIKAIKGVTKEVKKEQKNIIQWESQSWENVKQYRKGMFKTTVGIGRAKPELVQKGLEQQTPFAKDIYLNPAMQEVYIVAATAGIAKGVSFAKGPITRNVIKPAGRTLFKTGQKAISKFPRTSIFYRSGEKIGSRPIVSNARRWFFKDAKPFSVGYPKAKVLRKTTKIGNISQQEYYKRIVYEKTGERVFLSSSEADFAYKRINRILKPEANITFPRSTPNASVMYRGGKISGGQITDQILTFQTGPTKIPKLPPLQSKYSGFVRGESINVFSKPIEGPQSKWFRTVGKYMTTEFKKGKPVQRTQLVWLSPEKTSQLITSKTPKISILKNRQAAQQVMPKPKIPSTIIKTGKETTIRFGTNISKLYIPSRNISPSLYQPLIYGTIRFGKIEPKTYQHQIKTPISRQRVSTMSKTGLNLKLASLQAQEYRTMPISIQAQKVKLKTRTIQKSKTKTGLKLKTPNMPKPQQSYPSIIPTPLLPYILPKTGLFGKGRRSFSFGKIGYKHSFRIKKIKPLIKEIKL